MTSRKCPVCGKQDIPDYLSQDVVCPCCNNDLKIYQIVNAIKNDVQSPAPQFVAKRGKGKIAIIPTIVTCIFFLVAVFSIAELHKNKSEIKEIAAENTSLVEELTELKQEIAETTANKSAEAKVNFTYIVQHGDSFWRISKKLYGTGTKCEELARNNGLTINSPLKTGDALIVD